LFQRLTTTYRGMSTAQKVLAGVGAVVGYYVSYIAYYRVAETRYAFNSYTTSEQAINGLNLSNKCAIVTGSNTGIGKETAKVLYQQGCHVILACRNMEKGEKARSEIIDAVGPSAGNVEVMQLKLDSLQSVRDFATEFVSKHKQLNYLINNAGIMGLPEYKTSTDGYELQFAVNHIGHFYLGRLLLPTLVKSKGRVISLSSTAHVRCSYRIFDDFLQEAMKNTSGPAEQNYDPWINYGIAKTANVLFARELHRRYNKDGVTACSLHPGWVSGSELARNLKITLSDLVSMLPRFLRISFFMDNFKTLSQGAATTLRCVSLRDDEVKGGHYYHNCRSGVDAGVVRGAVKEVFSRQYNDFETESLDARLWTLSENLITQKGFKLTL